MINCKTIIHKNLKNILGNLGFKRKGDIYVRVINDVVQGIEIDIMLSGRKIEIDFDVFPTCYPLLELNYIPFGYSLSKLSKKTFGYMCDTNNESSVLKCAEDVISDINKYIIPMVSQVYNSKMCASARAKMDFMLFNSPLLNDEKKYWTYLKIREYDLALMIRIYKKYLYLYTINSIKLNEAMLTEEERKKEYLKFKDLLKRAEYEILSFNKFSEVDFDGMIAENEKGTLEMLKNNKYL